MSTGKSELFMYLGTSIGTLIGLYTLHIGYGTFLDQRYHAELAEGGAAEALVAAKAEQAKALDSGRMPIEQAMQKLAAGGRDSVAKIKPIQSTDLSPVSGWVKHPSYEAVVAHPIRTPRAVEAQLAAPQGEPAGTGASAIENGAAIENAAPAPTQAPTPAPAH